MSEKKDLKKVAEFIQKKNMYDRLGKEIDSLKNELKDSLIKTQLIFQKQ